MMVKRSISLKLVPKVFDSLPLDSVNSNGVILIKLKSSTGFSLTFRYCINQHGMNEFLNEISKLETILIQTWKISIQNPNTSQIRVIRNIWCRLKIGNYLLLTNDIKKVKFSENMHKDRFQQSRFGCSGMHKKCKFAWLQ